MDAIFYGNGNHLEHNFIVKPGADYRQIRMQFHANSQAHLEKVASYDPRFDLVIDPVLDFSTYLSSFGSDGLAIAADADAG